MNKTYTEQLEEVALELMKELAPLYLSDELATDIWAADVQRLRKLREMASEFSQACARRAAELLDREVRVNDQIHRPGPSGTGCTNDPAKQVC